MKKVLLSGAFASGKTEFSTILSDLGAGIIDVDCFCEDLFDPKGNERVFWHSVADDACFKHDGVLDVDVLLEHVLLNPAIFLSVRDYIFPKLTDAVQEKIDVLCSEGIYSYLLLIAPTGPMPYKKWIKHFELEFVLIEAPVERRIIQLIKRHHFTEERARVLAMKGEQWIAEVRPHSHRIITNDGDMESLMYQAKQLNADLLERSER